MVFLQDHPNHWPRTEIPGITLPNGNHVVELRGWLSSIDSASNPADPDWHFALEVDPDWLTEQGIDPGLFVKVGDILGFGKYLGPDPNNMNYSAFVSRPALHMELNGWSIYDGDQVRPGKPADWQVYVIHDPSTQGTVWPFNPWTMKADPAVVSWPTAPGATAEGDYVRVSGNLVSDIPHNRGEGKGWAEWRQSVFGAINQASYDEISQLWERGHDPNTPEDPARWTEVHPPDAIEVLSPQTQTSFYTGVALIAAGPVLDPAGQDNALDVDIRPPTPQPPGTHVGIEEHVGPETNFQTITEGNSARNGAQITLYPDHAHIHVKVHGAPLGGVPGKFKAVYRTWWQTDDGTMVDVPNLFGMSPANAGSTLRSAGLGLDVGNVTHGNVDAPRVETQTPAAGTLVARGGVVTVTVVEPRPGPQP
jgi:hypothetical protein